MCVFTAETATAKLFLPVVERFDDVFGMSIDFDY